MLTLLLLPYFLAVLLASMPCLLVSCPLALQASHVKQVFVSLANSLFFHIPPYSQGYTYARTLGMVHHYLWA